LSRRRAGSALLLEARKKKEQHVFENGKWGRKKPGQDTPAWKILCRRPVEQKKSIFIKT
jgi:hypothetical protein